MLLDSGILGGVSVNHFASNLEYETSGEQSVLGRHQNQMNGLQPYLGWISPEQRVRVWTSAGFGQGTIDYEIADVETLSVQTSHYVVAMGGSNRLYQSDEFLGGTGEVDLRSEAWTIQQDVDGSSIGIGNAQFNSNRIRVIAEAIHLARYSEESGIEAAASGGGRWDSDSMGNEFSIEVGSDLTYEIPHGFTVSGDALVLVGDAITVDHQSLRGTLQYDDLHDSLGFLAEVTSSIGDPKQGRDNARDLWQIDFSEDRDDLTVSEDDRQFEFELGYGYQIFDRRGVTTPYNRVVLRQQGRHEFRIGNRMLVGPKFSSDVEGFFSLEEKENEVGFSNSYKFSW